MSLKKTDMERLKAASITDRLHKSAPPERYAKGAQVPFAAKVVAEVLEKGLGK